MSGSKRPILEEMLIAEICSSMKWTYQEYMEQPQFLIDAIQIKMQVEAEYQEQQNKK